MLTITDIIDVAHQGITRPFLCRCDDGEEYFVKRANAGRTAQIAEWVAASLGHQLGLPVPPCDFAEVPPSLLSLRDRDERREWGTGPVFASRVVPHAVEIRFTDRARIPPRQQADILLFDAWIGNGDRTLSALGGNPNILWSDGDEQLAIIDHNLAFESPLAEVLAYHAFSEARSEWDVLALSVWPQRLATAASTMPQIWAQLPDIWLEECGDLLTLEMVQDRLQLFTDPADPAWSLR
jgi:hypothetical protein